MKFCQNCGKQISDTASFCPACGSKAESFGQPEPAYSETVQQPINEPAYSEPVEPTYNEPAYSEPIEQPSGGFSVRGLLSLIFGIVSLAFSFLYGIGLPFAIAGMVLGGKQLSLGFDKRAKTGKTLSIIGLVLSIVFLVFWIVLFAVLDA